MPAHRHHEAAETPVGVRELRQNLSAYLRRVAAGEAFRVTDRGREVAVLGPLPDRRTAVARLVADGRASAPTVERASLDLPLKVPLRMSSAEALELVREERLY